MLQPTKLIVKKQEIAIKLIPGPKQKIRKLVQKENWHLATINFEEPDDQSEIFVYKRWTEPAGFPRHHQ